MRRLSRVIPVVLSLASLLALALPRGGQTVPLFAARTGNTCQTCHFDPNGGGPRNDFGFAFARNRHSLAPEDSASEWHDLDLVNRVGDRMPLYVGINHRFLLLANTTIQSDSLDRAAFFNMENGLHLAFKPHQRLTLVYTRDGGISKEAFGMIEGFPWNGYLKAGQFRNPYGLRMDDHTVATRNGYLDFYSQSIASEPWAPLVSARFLPYDPRQVDAGVELGGEYGAYFGRVALTNGASNLFSGGAFGNPFAETKAIKLGYNHHGYQGGLSFYDDFQKNPGFNPYKRATRWSYYGLTSFGPLALLGELGAGTDELNANLGGSGKINQLAGFAELDYSARRSVSLRFRYDYMDLHRDDTVLNPGATEEVTLSDLNTHSRYAVEGEYVPVPFAELRWVVRRIDHKAKKDPLGVDIKDETQGYLQLHFSY